MGFDGSHTIGVWVGRPDGAPVPGLIGRLAAAPILFDAFARTGKSPTPLSAAAKGTLVAATAKLPPPRAALSSRALGGRKHRTAASHHVSANGARLELASDSSGKADPIALKVTGGTGPLTVLVNGLPVPGSRGGAALFFEPDGHGFVRLTVMDGRGAIDSVVVRLQ